MADQVMISGTDPTNPRCLADILLRLEQIKRDTKAMHAEALRLIMFAPSVRSLLTDRGLSEDAAQEVARGLARQLNTLADHLRDSSAYAGRSADTARDINIDPRARFTWRPARTER